jgi:sialic acid synthase SpsE
MIIKIKKNIISSQSPTYFIADIAANHDGSLSRAKKLIRLCALSGANAAKFQHFKAETIVSDFGFKKIGKITHQKKWKKSVFEVYKEASINNKWTKVLKKECEKNKIDFLTAPYDLDYVDSVFKYVSAYKIGSGDITWLDIIKKIAKKKKPVLLATGASSFEDVTRSVKEIMKYNKKIVLMQCNTNYTADNANHKFLNLKVLEQFKKKFKNKVILGLSDHTAGHNSVLGAVAMGARVVEKHFTDDNKRKGPDHKFSMNTKTWKAMVDETRMLENSLGDGHKKIEQNEEDAVIVQRRSIRAAKNLFKNEKIKESSLIFLRPAPKNSLAPYEKRKILNKTLKKDITKGDLINWSKIKN